MPLFSVFALGFPFPFLNQTHLSPPFYFSRTAGVGRKLKQTKAKSRSEGSKNASEFGLASSFGVPRLSTVGEVGSR